MTKRSLTRNWLVKPVVLLALAILACATFLVAKKESKFSGSGPEIRVYFHCSRQTKTIPLEEYVIGVVMAEMPASFEPEALKAQAVCARTYALAKAYDTSSHPEGAHVCDDPNHCQAYVDPAPAANAWKVNRIRSAVYATRGQVLTYRGQLATTYFHSSCGGRTAAASEVWGREVPYLTSVACPCPEISPYQTEEYTFTTREILHQLGISSFLGQPEIKITEYSETGRVRKIAIGKQVVTGAAFRRAVNLPSTWFTLVRNGHQVTVRCRGYGHGVGMCQYGANRLAQKGHSYRAILSYYFPGTELCRLAY